MNKKEVLNLFSEKIGMNKGVQSKKYQKIVHDNFFGLARFCTIFIYRTIFFRARFRARSCTIKFLT